MTEAQAIKLVRHWVANLNPNSQAHARQVNAARTVDRLEELAVDEAKAGGPLDFPFLIRLLTLPPPPPPVSPAEPGSLLPDEADVTRSGKPEDAAGDEYEPA